MSFDIPDNDVAFNPNQSRWYSADVDILAAGHGGIGVKSGCAVSAQGTPNMTVAVASGTIYVDAVGTEVSVGAGNVTIAAADATNPRIDLISASPVGVKTVTAGTPAAAPKTPDLPSGHVGLAFVYVPATDTAIAANQIVDKRVILREHPGAAEVPGTFVVGWDGGLAAPASGSYQDVIAPFAGTITGWTLLGDDDGSAVVDIWKEADPNLPPTVADSITASAKPTLSGDIHAQSTLLTGWTTTFSRGDVFRFRLDSATNLTKVMLVLDYDKDGGVLLSGAGPTLLGKTDIGASWQVFGGDNNHVAKKFTVPNAGIIFPPQMYIRGTATAADQGWSSSFWSDDGGSGSAARPLAPLTGVGSYAQLTRTLIQNTTIGWFTPLGAAPIYVTAGTYWVVIGPTYQGVYAELAYDSGGEDLIATYSTSQVMGVTNVHESYDMDFTTTTRNHSIRIPFFAGGGVSASSAPTSVEYLTTSDHASLTANRIVDIGATSLLSRRAVTNVEDDLFDGVSVDSKWTANGGTWSISSSPTGWIAATGGYLVQPVSAGDWTIETEVMAPASSASEYTGVGMFFSTSATPSTAGNTRTFFIGREQSGLTVFRLGGDNLTNGAFSSQIFSSTSFVWLSALHCFMRIVRASSTVYRFEVSNTGYNWQAVVSFNPSITPTHFGLYGKGWYNGFYRY